MAKCGRAGPPTAKLEVLRIEQRSGAARHPLLVGPRDEQFGHDRRRQPDPGQDAGVKMRVHGFQPDFP